MSRYRIMSLALLAITVVYTAILLLAGVPASWLYLVPVPLNIALIVYGFFLDDGRPQAGKGGGEGNQTDVR